MLVAYLQACGLKPGQSSLQDKHGSPSSISLTKMPCEQRQNMILSKRYKRKEDISKGKPLETVNVPKDFLNITLHWEKKNGFIADFVCYGDIKFHSTVSAIQNSLFFNYPVSEHTIY